MHVFLRVLFANYVTMFVHQAVATSLIQVGRSRGVRSTGVLFIYWTLHVVCAALILRSLVIDHVEEVRDVTSTQVCQQLVK